MNIKFFISSFLIFSLSFLIVNVDCDSPEAWQMSFQDPATPLMEGIINLHHDLMFIVIFIAIFVLWMLLRTVQLFSFRKNPVPSNFTKHPVLKTKPGELRMLQVDNAVVLPIQMHIRLLVTSMDVLHCWSVNSLGVKVDAVPGRLNQAAIYIKRPGMFTGQMPGWLAC